MIDWTILLSSICAFIFPGVILLEDTLSVIKYYNQIIKEKNPRKFTILSIAMYVSKHSNTKYWFIIYLLLRVAPQWGYDTWDGYTVHRKFNVVLVDPEIKNYI